MEKLKPLFIGLILLSILSSCEKEPSADFSFSSPTKVGEQVRFTNLSLNSDSYSWDFGDGATSTDKSPTHTYEKPGYYSVKLNANGKDGAASIKKIVNITGTTYSIRNSTSFTLSSFSSFYWNGSYIEDFVNHGTLTVGNGTGIIITNKTEISFGFEYMGETYVSVNPFNLTIDSHNNLVVDNTTAIYSGSKGPVPTTVDITMLDKKLRQVSLYIQHDSLSLYTTLPCTL